MKKVIVLATSLVSSAACVLATGAVILTSKGFEPASATVEPNKLVFDLSSEVHTIDCGDYFVDYAYSYTSEGNKYAIVELTRPSSTERYDEALITHKGLYKYISFAYGDVNPDGTFTQAHFKKGVNAVTIDGRYDYMADYSTVYTRVFFNSSPDLDTSKRVSSVTTRDYYNMPFNMAQKGAENTQYIYIGVSNGTVPFLFRSITIEYNC